MINSNWRETSNQINAAINSGDEDITCLQIILLAHSFWHSEPSGVVQCDLTIHDISEPEYNRFLSS